MSFQCSVCANKNTADCVLCQHCESFEPKHKTNYDRIISKTPEELADYLAAVSAYGSCGVLTDNARKGWLDWLKQEALPEEEG